MRRLKLQVQTTADGYMGGPNGEMDWLTWSWSADLNDYSDKLHESVDCIVLGRKLAEGFIPSWQARREDPQGESEETIEFMNNTPKVVISNSLSESPWESAVVAGGNLTEVITELKDQPGDDIIAYGGSEFVSSLVADSLIDDYHLFVNPAAIGAGLPIFPKAQIQLDLVGAKQFECGIAVLHYRPKSAG
ncbi:MAG: dihydrofolate reductase family protein [Anaerolineales bacterium]